jgi:hypothetical protein
MHMFTRNVILPRTQAICLAGMTDSDVYKLCTAFVKELSKPAHSGIVPSFMPLCEEGVKTPRFEPTHGAHILKQPLSSSQCVTTAATAPTTRIAMGS